MIISVFNENSCDHAINQFYLVDFVCPFKLSGSNDSYKARSGRIKLAKVVQISTDP